MKKKFKTKYTSPYSTEKETATFLLNSFTMDGIEYLEFDSFDDRLRGYDGMFPIKNAKQLEDIGNYFLKLATKYKNYEVK